MQTISTLFLQAAQFHIIVLILLIGLYFVDRKKFLKVLAFTLTSGVVNVCLKYTFKIPLKAHLAKDWYAFPSGHAQFSATFYGSIVTFFKNPLITTIGTILILGISWALVDHNYHDWIDVIVAVIVAIGLIGIFDWVEGHLFNQNLMLFVLVATFSTFIISTVFPVMGSHTWMSQGCLIGLSTTTLLEKFFGFKGFNPVIDFLIALGGIFAIIGVFAKFGSSAYMSMMTKYALITLWGTYSPHIFANLRR